MSRPGNNRSSLRDGPSQEEARRIMDDIREINGGLPEEDWNQMSERGRRAHINLQVMAGNSIVHVANDLYASDARFIFELIQNADDNKYTFAGERGQPKFLHFTLYPDKLTVESNEDGFSEQDLRSICSIHQSTKRQSSGYIGHKGIGFKSVFKVAKKVHIQSGPFSFTLERNDGDSGLGMVTPCNVSPESLPENVKTRMSLFFGDAHDFDTRARELMDIPKTILLFLENLDNIQVDLQPSAGPSSHLVFERSIEQGNKLRLEKSLTPDAHGTVTLTKTLDGNEQIDCFFTMKDHFTDLPEHQSRSNQRNASGTLAFPVNTSFKPLLEHQYVYSFLPVSREGFYFLVQSDFITDASRQSVHHCERNLAIREKLATLFYKAACIFCVREDSLRFDWIQYLPGEAVHNPFWTTFRDKIFSELRTINVFYDHGEKLKRSSTLQYLSDRQCDKNGQPLFDDNESGVYLSLEYNHSKNKNILEKLGITELRFETVLSLIGPYLQGLAPRILGSEIEDDWHSRVADLLIRGFKAGTNDVKNRIKKLNIIPCSDGSLRSTSVCSVHWPFDSEGNKIPENISTRSRNGISWIVDYKSWKNTSRRALFQLLGVTFAAPGYVRSLIIGRYNHPDRVTLQDSILHLKYLFLTSEAETDLSNLVYIFDLKKAPVYRAFVPHGMTCIVADLHFESGGTYGTSHLSQDYDIHIIHGDYISAVAEDTRVSNRTWIGWLEQVALVRHTPRLIDPKAQRLSGLLSEIADHEPMRFLGLLQFHQTSYANDMAKIKKEIQNVEVPVRGGGTSPLHKTYYPWDELTQICQKSGTEDIFDYFVDVPNGWPTSESSAWKFLTKFGVRMKPDSFFFSSILLELRRSRNVESRVFKIYEEMSKRLKEDELKELFSNQAEVFIPAINEIPAEWKSAENCLWMGHSSLRGKRPLDAHEEYSSRPHITHLFRNILSVQDADLSTYLEEIEFYKTDCQLQDLADDDGDNGGDNDENDDENGQEKEQENENDGEDDDEDYDYSESDNCQAQVINVSLSALFEMYNEIDQWACDDESAREISTAFDENHLIYIPIEKIWVPSYSCVWSDARKLGTQYGISEVYGDMSRLFQDVLNIYPPTTRTYIEQLKIQASLGYAAIGEIQDTIYNMNGMYFSDEEVNEIINLTFLPVRGPDGRFYLAKPTDTFFIMDRLEYESAFKDKVTTLDFPLEQIIRLHLFIESLKLDCRLISRLVNIYTEVEHPGSEVFPSGTRRLRKRAKHIFRCARNYQAISLEEDPLEIYHQLQTVNVYESEGFRKTLVLECEDIELAAQSDNGMVHFTFQDNVLQIFIPRDPQTREKCYRTALPRALSSYLGIRGEDAIQKLRTVFTTSEAILESVLNDDGVMPFCDPGDQEVDSDLAEETDSDALSTSTHAVSVNEEEEEEEEEEEDEAEQEVNGDVETSVISVNESQHDAPPPDSSTHQPTYTSNNSQVSQPFFRPRPITLLEPNHFVPDIGNLAQDQFIAALGNVISQARSADVLSFLRVFGLPNNSETNGSVNPFIISAANSFLRDIRIGAAGELFAFECLSRLNLPGFSRDNWKSTIRKEVNVHQDYQDLTPWRGTETADIVYHDTDFVLSSILIDMGYITGFPEGSNNRPTYYIEVKTTTSDRKTPFYMSHSQYLRMQSHGIGWFAPDKVYMILRVSKVTSPSIGMHLYFDPDKLRRDGMLIFSTDTWTVSCP